MQHFLGPIKLAARQKQRFSGQPISGTSKTAFFGPAHLQHAKYCVFGASQPAARQKQRIWGKSNQKHSKY
jgi:hypothetical protein